MLKKVWNFVKYNNGFLILLGLVFVFGGSVFAMSNENIKKSVQKNVTEIIGEKKIVEVGIDNSVLLKTDLDKLAEQTKILAVTDDENNFYVDYELKTLDVVENKWQEISKTGRLVVSKLELGEADLGVYAIKQINEVVATNLADLKIAQAREKEKGEAKIIKNEEYSGLLGVIMDIKDNFVEEAPQVELMPESNNSSETEGLIESSNETSEVESVIEPDTTPGDQPESSTISTSTETETVINESDGETEADKSDEKLETESKDKTDDSSSVDDSNTEATNSPAEAETTESNVDAVPADSSSADIQ